MTPQERELLTRFLVDLNNTPAGLKDAEAAAMIDDAIRARPDAAYVLVQHAIMADEALHRAQAELAQLRAQQQAQPASGGSFLGGATASSTVPPTGAPGANPWVQPPQPQYQQPQYQQAPYPQPQSGGIFGGGGGLGSFLRSAGTTAAGVVAGDMLFSSLGGLFGGHHGGGFGGGWGGGYGGGNVENVVINNYNDSGDDDGGSDGDWDDGN
jgi:uncharacterized protein